MILNRIWLTRTVVCVAALSLAFTAGCRRKKYENPITKDTQQPDKVLYDKAVRDIEKGRYEVARITLNTLINTYDTSEFMAKAKLAIADAWYREGGSHGLAQSEAEYKDFILFYPTLEEASESQYKICMIHYKQMEKVDRDASQALRAEQECRQLITQFPNSKYAPEAEQRLREIQEVIAASENKVATWYHNKGSHPAAANRFSGLITQYPLFSGADESLWLQGDSYEKMGNRFRPQAIESYQKIVRDYPLSARVDEAKKKLTSLEAEIPEADPVAIARMKYEQENYRKPGMMRRTFGFMGRGPDVSASAKSGSPSMSSLRPTVPASVPPAQEPGVTDVTATAGTPGATIEQQPDARMAPPAAGSGTAAAPAPAPAANEPLPMNRQVPVKPKKVKKQKNQPAAEQPAAKTEAKK